MATILIVDDEPMVQTLLKQYLEQHGYQVKTAGNGPEALAAVDRGAPDLVILDLYMPGMNGIEVLRELREARRYPGGVLVLTASRDEQLLGQALELGSVEVLTKPVDFDRLSLAIEVGLAVSGGGEASRRQG